MKNLLSGKCKEEFEKWFLTLDLCQPEQFETWLISMQFGVYQDFFELHGIKVDVTKENTTISNFYQSNVESYLGAWPSRDEARKRAIQDADDTFFARNNHKSQKEY